MSHLGPVIMRNPPGWPGRRPKSYSFKPRTSSEENEGDEGDEGDDEPEHGGSESDDSETITDGGEGGEERDAESEAKAEQRAPTQTEHKGSESPEIIN